LAGSGAAGSNTAGLAVGGGAALLGAVRGLAPSSTGPAGGGGGGGVADHPRVKGSGPQLDMMTGALHGSVIAAYSYEEFDLIWVRVLGLGGE
jgi:hypothetical protein